MSEKKDDFFKKLDGLNKKFMDSELITPNVYYIDVQFIKDIRLGTILFYISTQDTQKQETLYSYFKEGLLSYQTRMFDETMVHFPKLDLTEEQFLSFLHDKNYSDSIFEMSPITEYPHAIKATLDINVNHSQVAEKWKDTPLLDNNRKFTRKYESVTFVVNTYPLEIDKYNKDRLGGFLAKYFGVNVHIISENPKTISSNIMEKMEDLTLYNIGDYLDNDNLRKSFEEFKMLGKHVHTPLLFQPQSKDYLNSNEEIEKQIKIITDCLRIYCHLQWIASARFAVDLTLFPIDDPEEGIDMAAPLPTLR